MVPNPLAIIVVAMEETDVMDWCDKFFMPHAPCEEDKQEQEEADDDNDDDDVCMMGFSMSSQQGETSIE
ncbi:hypothetical protein KI387_021492, partial [Taxus chinensis]